MALSFSPMSLSDLFDQIFRLIGKTAGRNLVIALILLAPASVLLAYGMDDFFSHIIDFARHPETAQEAGLAVLVLPVLSALTLFSATLLLFYLATIAATLGI